MHIRFTRDSKGTQSTLDRRSGSALLSPARSATPSVLFPSRTAPTDHTVGGHQPSMAQTTAGLSVSPSSSLSHPRSFTQNGRRATLRRFENRRPPVVDPVVILDADSLPFCFLLNLIETGIGERRFATQEHQLGVTSGRPNLSNKSRTMSSYLSK